MKKLLIIIGITVAAASGRAQTMHVNNSNGTYQAIEAADIHEITFDATQRLISIETNDEIRSRFATDAIDSIAFSAPAGRELTYSKELDVTLDANDESTYSEIVETIITDELVDESGDFLENYTVGQNITINFSETGITYTPSIVSGITFSVSNGTHLTINSSNSKMRYILKGSCSDGSVKIYSTKKFQLMLNNLELTNPQGPAINIQSGKTVYATIANGTTNTLCDGETYAEPSVAGESQKGTFFSEGQLIFNGNGTLNVTSYGGHAICSDDYIRVRSGKINILGAAKDGFHTNDKFRVGRTEDYSPQINITAQGDGIDVGKGDVTIEAGKITMNTVGEGIKVSNEELDATVTPNATIRGGFIKIITTGEKSSGIKTEGDFTLTGGSIQSKVNGNGSKIVNSDGNIAITGGKLTGIAYGTQSADTTSAGGFKCNGNVNITSGTIALKCTGEGAKGINCNSSVIIDGGDITITSTAANYTQTTDDKKTRAITCNELSQNGGTLRLQAYDHALNATSIQLREGTINAFSSNSAALSVDATQSGGWLLTQGK